MSLTQFSCPVKLNKLVPCTKSHTPIVLSREAVTHTF